MKRYIALLFMIAASVRTDAADSPKIVLQHVNEAYFKHQLLEVQEALKQHDPGFDHWELLSYRFPQNMPLELRWERPLFNLLLGEVLVFSRSQFIVHPDGQSYCWPKESEFFRFCISVRGFLPGERIYAIISGKKSGCEYGTTSFIPRPIIATNEQGEVMLWAELMQFVPLRYCVHIVGVSPEQCYEITSDTGYGNFSWKGPLTLSVAPHMESDGSGSGHFALLLEEQRYEIALPWGAVLMNCLGGKI